MDSEKKEVDLPVLSEEQLTALKDMAKQELKLESEERRKKLNLQYRMPISKFAKSEMAAKVIGAAYGLGFCMPRDVCEAMGLQKGQMVKLTIELYPDDVAKLFSTL